MVLITKSGPDTLKIGDSAPDFSLPATDGETYSLASFKNSKVLVMSFTCNHCPYANAVEGRFIKLAREFQDKGAAFLAISANDAKNYPQDSFDNMKKRAEQNEFPFPYAYDESQQVARAYGAVCTPHIFVFGEDRTLIYEGAVDDNWEKASEVKQHFLRDAVEAGLKNEAPPTPQTGPVGCSIKWK